MKQEDLKAMRQEITALIDDVKYQSDSLTDLERLPVIQLKVILAKMNKLTEKTVVLLHYIEKQGRLSDVTAESSLKEVKIPANSEKEIELKEEIAQEVIEEIIEEVVEDIADEKIEAEENTENTEVEVKTEEVKKSGNLEDKLKRLAVRDLNSAIGINEKYLFSSELFSGNTQLFAEVIRQLNEMEEWLEAQSFLDALGKEYSWNLESDSVQNFIDLVERKFNQS